MTAPQPGPPSSQLTRKHGAWRSSSPNQVCHVVLIRADTARNKCWLARSPYGLRAVGIHVALFSTVDVACALRVRVALPLVHGG